MWSVWSPYPTVFARILSPFSVILYFFQKMIVFGNSFCKGGGAIPLGRLITSLGRRE